MFYGCFHAPGGNPGDKEPLTLTMAFAVGVLLAAASSPPPDNRTLEIVVLEGRVTFYMEDHFDTVQHFKVQTVIIIIGSVESPSSFVLS